MVDPATPADVHETLDPVGLDGLRAYLAHTPRGLAGGPVDLSLEQDLREDLEAEAIPAGCR